MPFPAITPRRSEVVGTTRRSQRPAVLLVAEIDAHADGATIRNDLEGFAELGCGEEVEGRLVDIWKGLSVETQNWLCGHTRQSGQHQYSEDLVIVHENGGEAIAVEARQALWDLLAVVRPGKRVRVGEPRDRGSLART